MSRFLLVYHATIYRLALLGTALLALLPASSVDSVAAYLGRLIYRRSGRRGAQLRANLRAALEPDASDKQIAALAEKVYANYGRYMAEFFTLHWPDIWGRRKRFIVDERPLREAKRRGRGVVLFGIHAGNWDLAASECAKRFGVFHSAGETVEPPWLGRLVNRVRRGGHTPLYDSMQAARPLLRALRNGDVVGLVADRPVAGPGVNVSLCERTAVLPAGPVWLALQNNAPLLPTFIERTANGALHVEFWQAIDLDGLEPTAAGIKTGTQRMADALTLMIRRGHTSWFALQPVWPDIHPEPPSIRNEPVP